MNGLIVTTGACLSNLIVLSSAFDKEKAKSNGIVFGKPFPRDKPIRIDEQHIKMQLHKHEEMYGQRCKLRNKGTYMGWTKESGKDFNQLRDFEEERRIFEDGPKTRLTLFKDIPFTAGYKDGMPYLPAAKTVGGEKYYRVPMDIQFGWAPWYKQPLMSETNLRKCRKSMNRMGVYYTHCTNGMRYGHSCMGENCMINCLELFPSLKSTNENYCAICFLKKFKNSLTETQKKRNAKFHEDELKHPGFYCSFSRDRDAKLLEKHMTEYFKERSRELRFMDFKYHTQMSQLFSPETQEFYREGATVHFNVWKQKGDNREWVNVEGKIVKRFREFEENNKLKVMLKIKISPEVLRKEKGWWAWIKAKLGLHNTVCIEVGATNLHISEAGKKVYKTLDNGEKTLEGIPAWKEFFDKEYDQYHPYGKNYKEGEEPHSTLTDEERSLHEEEDPSSEDTISIHEKEDAEIHLLEEDWPTEQDLYEANELYELSNEALGYKKSDASVLSDPSVVGTERRRMLVNRLIAAEMN